MTEIDAVVHQVRDGYIIAFARDDAEGLLARSRHRVLPWPMTAGQAREVVASLRRRGVVVEDGALEFTAMDAMALLIGKLVHWVGGVGAVVACGMAAWGLATTAFR
jgi:hypothetical protein